MYLSSTRDFIVVTKGMTTGGKWRASCLDFPRTTRFQKSNIRMRTFGSWFFGAKVSSGRPWVRRAIYPLSSFPCRYQLATLQMNIRRLLLGLWKYIIHVVGNICTGCVHSFICLVTLGSVPFANRTDWNRIPWQHSSFLPMWHMTVRPSIVRLRLYS